MLNTGKHQASIMYLNECLSISKTYSPNAYLYIAINFKMIGNFKQAIKVLEEGLSLFPNF
jgi:tetratricopeptide (TPR) repeat protein